MVRSTLSLLIQDPTNHQYEPYMDMDTVKNRWSQNTLGKHYIVCTWKQYGYMSLNMRFYNSGQKNEVTNSTTLVRKAIQWALKGDWAYTCVEQVDRQHVAHPDTFRVQYYTWLNTPTYC